MGLKLPKTITEEELLKVVKATKKSYHKTAFLLGFYQCLRVSEVTKLTKGDCKEYSKILSIVQSKGSKDREIPMAKELMNKKMTKFLLMNDIPINCGARALQIKFRQITKKVLGRSYNFHTLRHSGITFLFTQRKWSAPVVQKFAGHSNIKTTMIYTHITPQDLVEAMFNG